MYPGTEIVFVTASARLLEAAKAQGIETIDPVKLQVPEAAPAQEMELAKETE